jgi:peroxiredoxin Q/BCP
VPDPVAVGEVAPDFSLPGTGGRSWTLSEFRGRPVVLAFYPGDGTPVCTEQLNSYSNGIAAFDELETQVLAISPQDVASHERWMGEQHFRFPLLADVGKTVGERYGVLGPLGFYRRSVFVVDADGIVRYSHRSATGMTFRPADELVDAVRAALARS